MKQFLLILLSGSLLFAGCKKNENFEAPKTGVQFKFSDFNWEVGPLGKSDAAISTDLEYTGDTLSNYATYFYYRAYNSSGVKVSEKSQTSSAVDFGRITDLLEPGTYTVIFIASDKPLGMSRYGFDKDHCFNVDNGCWEDTFFKKMSIQVGDEALTHSLTLERIVGALELTLLDIIPESASKITISADYELGVYSFKNGSRTATATKTKEFLLTDDDRGHTRRTFLMHILNTNRALNITITSVNDQNQVLASKTVNGVSFHQNRKTSLVGNLYSLSSFSVNLDPIWGIPMSPVNF